MDASAEQSATASAVTRYTSVAATARHCRKESGSTFSVYAHWPVEMFELTGEIASYDDRGFCARCGSRLLDLSNVEDGIIEIRIGSLDDAPFELTPQTEIWVKRRESWIPPVEGAAQHDENRH